MPGLLLEFGGLSGKQPAAPLSTENTAYSTWSWAGRELEERPVISEDFRRGFRSCHTNSSRWRRHGENGVAGQKRGA